MRYFLILLLTLSGLSSTLAGCGQQRGIEPDRPPAITPPPSGLNENPGEPQR